MTEDREKLRVLNLERELERLSEENDNVMILNKSLRDDIKDLKKDNKILARQIEDKENLVGRLRKQGLI
jgi:predicted  nucleic acid-binding Zn-ribbon protein|tara:strand:- start:191 stop:397 length:207 start_codon:yes stop_codon:yes gene_type:complete